MKRWLSPQLIGLHLLAITVVCVCLLLSRWQLGSYEHRQADDRADKAHVSAVPIEKVWGPRQDFTDKQLLKKVTVTGTFRPAAEQFWVTQKGDDPWLVAPVTVDGTDLLVVRGVGRMVGPLPAVPEGEVTFTARLLPSDDDTDVSFNEADRTIGSVRVPELLNVYTDQLWSGYAIVTDGSSEVTAGLPLAPVKEPKPDWTTGGVNLGYGLQWIVFAGFAIYMWWRMCRERLDELDQRRRDRESEARDEVAGVALPRD